MWRKEELDAADALPTEEARRAARLALLQQQATHLSTIDTMRHQRGQDRRAARIRAFFATTGAPHAWTEATYGLANTLDTPEKQRARELGEVYAALQVADGVAPAARLDLLLHVRLVVEPHATALTRDIVALVQREADLLGRGAAPGVLAGTRRRLANLFLQFCETPAFNPEAARVLAVHRPVAAVRGAFRQCAGCGRCLALTAFDVSFASAGFGKCTACLRLENQSLARSDGTHHERILRAVQKAELALDPASRCCFAVSVADMRFLIEAVWGAKSGLSQEADLAQLGMTRWRRAAPWTPWNTVLLTAPQAAAHAAIDDPAAVYGPAFAAAVARRHLQARAKFTALAAQFPDA